MSNDPSDGSGIDQSSRGLGMQTFGEDVFEEFLRVNGLEQMDRGHSVFEEGFRWWFGGVGSHKQLPPQERIL